MDTYKKELKNRNDNDDDYDISNIRVAAVESLLEFQSSDDRNFWSSLYIHSRVYLCTVYSVPFKCCKYGHKHTCLAVAQHFSSTNNTTTHINKQNELTCMHCMARTPSTITNQQTHTHTHSLNDTWILKQSSEKFKNHTQNNENTTHAF